MATTRSLQVNTIKLLLFATALALLCAIPSFAQPSRVSAQTCPYGQTSVYYPGSGYSCTGGTAGTYGAVNCGTFVSYSGSCSNSSCAGLINGCNNCAYGTSVCNTCGILGSSCNNACGVYPYTSTYGGACGGCGNAYPYTSTYGGACGGCGSTYPYTSTYGGACGGCGSTYPYTSTYGGTCGANCPYGGVYPTCTNTSSCPYGGIYPTCTNSSSCPYGGIYPTCSGGGCSGTYTLALNTGCNPNAYSNQYNQYNGAGGTCVGVALQPGQSCTNGQIVNSATAAAGGCQLFSQTTGACIQQAAAATTTGCAQFSTTTGQCIAPTNTGASTAGNCGSGQFSTAGGCSASTVSTQVTCPGTGTTITISGNQTAATACPVICYTSAGLAQYEPPGQACPTGTTSTQPAAGATTTTAASTAATLGTSSYAALTTGAAGTGFSISVQAGWDLLGGPVGTTPTQTDGSVYTWKAGDSAYEQAGGSTAFTSGEGAWVHFAAPATISLPTVAAGSASVQLPSGQFVMIGNGGDAPATVTGADHVFTYSPTAGYTQTNTLAPGQGAWAESDNGGTATITWGASTGAAS